MRQSKTTCNGCDMKETLHWNPTAGSIWGWKKIPRKSYMIRWQVLDIASYATRLQHGGSWTSWKASHSFSLPSPLLDSLLRCCLTRHLRLPSGPYNFYPREACARYTEKQVKGTEVFNCFWLSPLWLSISFVSDSILSTHRPSNLGCSSERISRRFPMRLSNETVPI